MSVFTVFVAGMGACSEVDMKKVVALSTLSQLGVMIFSLRLGFYSLAFFHLIRHALFKALLFVGVGCVIHGCGGWQDIRMIRGLWGKMPLVGACVLLAGLALRGLPFMRGFYSKDLIVEALLEGGASLVLVLVFFVGLLITFVYSLRLFVRSVCGGDECFVSMRVGS